MHGVDRNLSETDLRSHRQAGRIRGAESGPAVLRAGSRFPVPRCCRELRGGHRQPAVGSRQPATDNQPASRGGQVTWNDVIYMLPEIVLTIGASLLLIAPVIGWRERGEAA